MVAERVRIFLLLLLLWLLIYTGFGVVVSRFDHLGCLAIGHDYVSSLRLKLLFYCSISWLLIHHFKLAIGQILSALARIVALPNALLLRLHLLLLLLLLLVLLLQLQLLIWSPLDAVDSTKAGMSAPLGDPIEAFIRFKRTVEVDLATAA